MSNQPLVLWKDYLDQNASKKIDLLYKEKYDKFTNSVEALIRENRLADINKLQEEVLDFKKEYVANSMPYDSIIYGVYDGLYFVLLQISEEMKKNVKATESNKPLDHTFLNASQFIPEFHKTFTLEKEEPKKSLAYMVMISSSIPFMLSSLLVIVGMGLKINIFNPTLPGLNMGLSIANYALLSITLILIVTAAVIAGRKKTKDVPPSSDNTVFSDSFVSDGTYACGPGTRFPDQSRTKTKHHSLPRSVKN